MQTEAFRRIIQSLDMQETLFVISALTPSKAKDVIKFMFGEQRELFFMI